MWTPGGRPRTPSHFPITVRYAFRTTGFSLSAARALVCEHQRSHPRVSFSATASDWRSAFTMPDAVELKTPLSAALNHPC